MISHKPAIILIILILMLLVTPTGVVGDMPLRGATLESVTDQTVPENVIQDKSTDVADNFEKALDIDKESTLQTESQDSFDSKILMPLKADEKAYDPLYTIGSDEVYKFISDCSVLAFKKIVWLAGISGGYINPGDNFNDLGMPYYYNQGVKSIISKEELEENISHYFNQELAICLNDFKNFKDLNINSEEIKSNVVIHDEEVILELDYLVHIRKGEGSCIIDKFDKKILELKLGKILKIVEKIVNEDIKEDSLCLDCSLDDLEENNLKMEILDYEEKYVFIIIDELNRFKEMEFRYSFGVKK